jgi:hypothetical protein
MADATVQMRPIPYDLFFGGSNTCICNTINLLDNNRRRSRLPTYLRLEGAEYAGFLLSMYKEDDDESLHNCEFDITDSKPIQRFSDDDKATATSTLSCEKYSLEIVDSSHGSSLIHTSPAYQGNCSKLVENEIPEEVTFVNPSSMEAILNYYITGDGCSNIILEEPNSDLERLTIPVTIKSITDYLSKTGVVVPKMDEDHPLYGIDDDHAIKKGLVQRRIICSYY